MTAGVFPREAGKYPASRENTPPRVREQRRYRAMPPKDSTTQPMPKKRTEPKKTAAQKTKRGLSSKASCAEAPENTRSVSGGDGKGGDREQENGEMQEDEEEKAEEKEASQELKKNKNNNKRKRTETSKRNSQSEQKPKKKKQTTMNEENGEEQEEKEQTKEKEAIQEGRNDKKRKRTEKSKMNSQSEQKSKKTKKKQKTIKIICEPCGRELKNGEPRYRNFRRHYACGLACKAVDRLGIKDPKVR